MRVTRAEQQMQTRAALLAAASEVFIDRGLRGASVEQISLRAGFTRGAFYSNFKDLDEAFVAVLRERVDDLYGDFVDAALERPPQPGDAARQLAALQAGPGASELRQLWLECVALAPRNERLREFSAQLLRERRALAEEIVRRGLPSRAPHAAHLGLALVALDLGLAMQHSLDDDVPLDAYRGVYQALFDR